MPMYVNYSEEGNEATLTELDDETFECIRYVSIPRSKVARKKLPIDELYGHIALQHAL